MTLEWNRGARRKVATTSTAIISVLSRISSLYVGHTSISSNLLFFPMLIQLLLLLLLLLLLFVFKEISERIQTFCMSIPQSGGKKCQDV